jgi:glycosidase
MAARERDWRIGAIVYQVYVDRFAPSRHLDAKRARYAAPKRLRDWSETPKAGSYLENEKLWSHEIDFWGGDIDSLEGRLDYIEQLGADVLYLNPIHAAYTNHKYDALDYRAVSSEYGTRDEVRRLAADVHRRRMKLVLDGVFNHMGRNAPIFKQAEANPNSPYRYWFDFNKNYKGGVRAWVGAQNLPELNLENPEVQRYIWGAPDSVVRGWLRDGADGWRLDVGFEIGPALLGELTKAAHAQKPGSLVLGEVANYPRDWFPALDGILGFTLRRIMIGLATGRQQPDEGARWIARMIEESGVENMLRSWIYLDNHDMPRFATVMPDRSQARLAQLLMFTLPGSPCMYYGSELGMTGGDDPEMRAPMRWDLVREDNEVLSFTRKLIALRKQRRALRIGNYRPLDAQGLLAFERYTEHALDAVVAVFNFSDQEIEHRLLVPDGKQMDGSRWIDQLTGTVFHMSSALMTVKLPARGALLLTPEGAVVDGYTNYKRVL